MKKMKSYYLLLICLLICTVICMGCALTGQSNSETENNTITETESDTITENDTTPESDIVPATDETVSEEAVPAEPPIKPATYSDHASAYNESNTTEVLVMTADDRYTYRPGFFYQSITEDVKQRINGLSYKDDCTVPYEDLRYVSVLYKDFDQETQVGEIVCNKAIAQDLVEIFFELYCAGYEIDKIRLVDEYNADDDLSCADNNTSCFNFRQVYGSNNLSKHALGLAIDINPFQNPYVTYPNGVERISPPGSEPYADRNSGLDHMITEDDLCYQLFAEHGFTWGGHWKTLKDYQHFQKPLD